MFLSFVDINKLTIKSVQKSEETRIANTNLKTRTMWEDSSHLFSRIMKNVQQSCECGVGQSLEIYVSMEKNRVQK